jgi:hypothetical protein
LNLGPHPHLVLPSSLQALYDYNVSISTSSLRGAMYKGVAYIMLNGWWGNTKELPLLNSGEQSHLFDAGTTEEIIIKGEDVGPISSIQIRIVSHGVALASPHILCVSFKTFRL